jgi:hypothetical protein
MFSVAVIFPGHLVDWVILVSGVDFSARVESVRAPNAHDVFAREYPMLSSLSILVMEPAGPDLDRATVMN